jgi:superfamily II DNA or RNA helicase
MAEYEARMINYNLYKDTFDELSGEQDDILQQFENNEFQFLVNKDILTAGYDCPDIETVIIYRLTQSISLWLQMLGRGSRIFENKTHFNVMYFGDNYKDLGAYDEDRDWSLWHEEKKGEGLPPVKYCGITPSGRPINKEGEKAGCKRMIHASAKICPKCGFIYPEKEILEAELTGVALDLDSGDFIRHKRIKDMSISELESHRDMKNYKMPWLWKQLYIRGGFELVESYCNEKGYNKGTIELARKLCAN